MAAYVNTRRDYAAGETGAQDAIQLNRWSRDDYSVRLGFDTTGTVTVEGTLDYINRLDAPAPVWFDITALVGVTVDTADVIQETPLEAIRLNIAVNATGVLFHVMQSGEG